MLNRRTFLAAASASATAPFLLGSPAADAAPRAGKVLARGLRVPWGLAFLPNGDALVTERETGKVYRIDRKGGRRLIEKIKGVDTSDSAGEGGLLGVAVSPDFATDRHVFLYLTASDDNRIIRVTYQNGAFSDRTLILGGIPKAPSHNGGRLAFGPSGHLFATTGDSRDEDSAQDTGSLGGKILRLNSDGSQPDGNPFDNLVWTYGHRNVQGIDWDGKGRMWATEFGENTRDELNRIRKGRNYGWPEVEGGDGNGGFADPFVTWAPTSTCSPSGVAIIKGRAWVGALAGRCIYSVRLNDPKKRKIKRHFHDTHGRIRTVQRAPDDSLWITTSNRDGRGTPDGSDDKVIRLVF